MPTIVGLGNVLSCIALTYAISAFMRAMRECDMAEDFQHIHDMLVDITTDVADNVNLSSYMKEQLGKPLDEIKKVAETDAEKWHDSDRWAMHGVIALFVTMALFAGSHILQDQFDQIHDEGFRSGRNAAYDEMLMEGIPVRDRKEPLEDKK